MFNLQPDPEEPDLMWSRPHRPQHFSLLTNEPLTIWELSNPQGRQTLRQYPGPAPILHYPRTVALFDRMQLLEFQHHLSPMH